MCADVLDDAVDERKYLYESAMNTKLRSGRAEPHVVDVGELLVELFGIESTTLFIRSHYGRLFHMQYWDRVAFRSVLLGPPGISKSVSLLYFLIRRVQGGHATCFHELENHRTWLFANGTCLKFVSASDAAQFTHNYASDPEFVVLLDRVKCNPRDYPSSRRAIMASSPHLDNYHEWMKLSSNTAGRHFYIPMYDLIELQRFRDLVIPEITFEITKQRFSS